MDTLNELYVPRLKAFQEQFYKVAKFKHDLCCQVGYPEWTTFNDYWMEHNVSNGLSIMAMDKQNCRMAGALTLKVATFEFGELFELFIG